MARALRLTPFLLEQGGHIGYSVRPSARRQGIASAALEGIREGKRRYWIGDGPRPTT